MAEPLLILGIDPGLRHCGWGVIAAQGSRVSFVACGRISPPVKGTLAERLCALDAGLADLLDTHTPHEAAVEETFVNTDPRSALRLGQARGVCLLAPARLGVPVAEYAANQIKKSVVGAGHADKRQIAAMVGHLLPGCRAETPDAADALAIALCHAFQRKARNLLAAAS
ncbi:MAG: crossover junction endodeoxyribonuclease RuvC [Parvularcula sp.]|nr:crossover junction endodeoxyribonuclease RuvC [Parvularcula sp.]